MATMAAAASALVPVAFGGSPNQSTVLRFTHSQLHSGGVAKLKSSAARTQRSLAGEAPGGRVVCQSLGEKTYKGTTQQDSKEDFNQKGAEKEDAAASPFTQQTLISDTLASRWREIQGENDWKGLLDPMDMDLRMELIRVGEFAQACYDTFDNQSHSKYMGSSLYNKDKMLEKVGLPDTGYEVTDFLFATTSVESLLLRNDAPDAWSRSSNWVGFIAVCTDPEKIKKLGRRDIVLAWRGTATKLEWAANLARSLVHDTLDLSAGQVKVPWNMEVKLEEGFLNLYTTANTQTRYNRASVREQVLTEMGRLIKKYDNEELSITITGHSLGGALSVLSAYDIAVSGVNVHGVDVKVDKNVNEPSVVTPTSDQSKTKMTGRKIPVTAFTFAGPRVGNNPFADKVRELGVKVLRVVNSQDMVPKVPSLIFNEDFTLFNNALDFFPWTYSHVGEEIELDHDYSPFLNARGNFMNNHNMEAYLHLITGHHGRNIPWRQVVERDVALINKASEFLCPKKTGIPANWWQPANKGLVRNKEGMWVLPERDFEDVPDTILEEKHSKLDEHSPFKEN